MAVPRSAMRSVRCVPCALMILQLVLAGPLSADDIRVADASGGEWVMTVTPRPAQAVPAASSVEDVAEQPAPSAPGLLPLAASVNPTEPLIRPRMDRVPPVVNGMTYEQAYASIPYRRHEYLANPSYRHEAAMELLFGQLRPTTIHKQVTPRWVPEEAFTPYRPYIPSNSDYWTVPRPVIGLPPWYFSGYPWYAGGLW